MHSDIEKVHKHLQIARSIEHFKETAKRLRDVEKQAKSQQQHFEDYATKFPNLQPLENFLDTYCEDD